MVEKEKPAVVIDNGLEMCKAGFAGDEYPKVVFSSIIDQKEVYDEEAQVKQKRGVLSLKFPNITSNWDDLEKIWHRCFFNELKIASEEYSVHLTEAPMNPKKTREKMTEILFETFNVPNFYISIQAVLPLYVSGRITGIVLDSGQNATHVVPIYEGYNLPHLITKINFGGSNMTSDLKKMLEENFINFSSLAKKEILQDIKEKLCYVALDYETEKKIYSESSVMDKTYELPDGKIVYLSKQRFMCPEALFHPKKYGYQFSGLHEMINQCIMNCDIDLIKDLYGNIVLSGGNTMFFGIAERLRKELAALNTLSMKINVIAPPERKYSAWMGGSILSSLSIFQTLWITKTEYEESGPEIVHRKYF